MGQTTHTLVLGNYATTAIVEHIAAQYALCIDNPKDVEQMLAQRKQSLFVSHPPPRCLVIFNIKDGPSLSHQAKFEIFYKASEYCIDVLFLDEDGDIRTLTESFPFDHIYWFKKQGAPWSYEQVWQLHCMRRILTDDLHIARCFVGLLENQAVYLDGNGSTRLLTICPRFWTPETHYLFPATVQARVRLLLLAQLDPGSLIGRLDKATLLEILRHNAGMDIGFSFNTNPIGWLI